MAYFFNPSILFPICISTFILMFGYGCETEESSFKAAQAENTVKAYEGFIIQFPDGINAQFASKIIDSIEFDSAVMMNTPEGYMDYLTKYPNASQVKRAQNAYIRTTLEKVYSDVPRSILADYSLQLNKALDSKNPGRAVKQLNEKSYKQRVEFNSKMINLFKGDSLLRKEIELWLINDPKNENDLTYDQVEWYGDGIKRALKDKFGADIVDINE